MKEEGEGETRSFSRGDKVDHWVPAVWIPDGKNEVLYEMWSKFFWVALTETSLSFMWMWVLLWTGWFYFNYTFPS